MKMIQVGWCAVAEEPQTVNFFQKDFCGFFYLFYFEFDTNHCVLGVSLQKCSAVAASHVNVLTAADGPRFQSAQCNKND